MFEPAADHGVQGPHGSDCVQIPAQEIEPRKRQVLRADHHRQDEISQSRRHDRHEEKEHHDHAVQREQPVVGIGLDQPALGRKQIEPRDRDRKAADEEHHRHRHQVQDTDAFVVPGQQPGKHSTTDVEVVLRLSRRRDYDDDAALVDLRAHGSRSSAPGRSLARSFPDSIRTGGGNASTRWGVSPGDKDLMNPTSAMTSSSLSSPANVGMMFS